MDISIDDIIKENNELIKNNNELEIETKWLMYDIQKKDEYIKQNKKLIAELEEKLSIIQDQFIREIATRELRIEQLEESLIKISLEKVDI